MGGSFREDIWVVVLCEDILCDDILCEDIWVVVLCEDIWVVVLSVRIF